MGEPWSDSNHRRVRHRKEDIMRLISVTFLFCVLLHRGIGSAHVGSASAGPKEEPRLADFDKLAEVFAPPGTPSIKGKSGVSVDTGPANFSTKWQGWLLLDSPEQITIIDRYGDVQKLRKPAKTEDRPKVKQEKSGGVLLETLQQADFSVAWEVRPEDYFASSKKFLADGLPKERDRDGSPGAWSVAADRFGLADQVIEAARYAHVAHLLGEKKHAAELYRHAEQAYKKYAEHYVFGGDKKLELHAFVADRLASSLRNAAIYAGHGSTSRTDLKKQWEKIIAIPFHSHRDEASDMIKHYESLIKDDGAWKEPDGKGLAKMTTEAKCSYWLYHLRDLDIGQWSDPGHCYVLGGRFGFLALDEEEKKNQTRPWS